MSRNVHVSTAPSSHSKSSSQCRRPSRRCRALHEDHSSRTSAGTVAEGAKIGESIDREGGEEGEEGIRVANELTGIGDTIGELGGEEGIRVADELMGIGDTIGELLLAM